MKRRMGISAAAICVIWSASSMADLTYRYATIDFPNADWTHLYGINDGGEIVGRYGSGGVNHGLTLIGGTFNTIDYPGSTWTEVYGINDSGDIVGHYEDATGAHGFGPPGTIDFPGAGNQFTHAMGINDNGLIVGRYRFAGDGWVHGFVASPVPTPAAILLGLIGLGIAGWRTRKYA